MNDTTKTAAVEPKLTAREKLMAKYDKLAAKAAELTAEVNKVVEEINALDALASITVGSPVIVTIGKGESAKEVDAVVVGVKDDEDGSKVYKVQYGTGFDADIAVVKQGKITLPVPAPAVSEVPGTPE
jgi:hypothetical protein